VIKVTGFYYESPKVTFCYRKNQIANISGEKINQLAFDEIIDNFSTRINELFIGYSIYPDRESSPGHYCLLVETENIFDKSKEDELSAIFDEELCKGNVSVEPLMRSGALGKSEVKLLQKGTYDAYREVLRQNGANLNQIKPIKLIDTEKKKEFFFSNLV
jgi:hypothetical protein